MRGGKKWRTLNLNSNDFVENTDTNSILSQLTCALHFSLSNLFASASRVLSALSCLMTPDDVTRCNERSILSGREKVKGASVSGSWERERE